MASKQVEGGESGRRPAGAAQAAAHEGRDPDPGAASEWILSRCHELGFGLAGICDARPSDHAELVLRWLREGRHGEMAYLASAVSKRLDPRELVAGAQSIVCVADRYSDGRPDRLGRPLHGRIARYARGRDYHRVLRGRLERLRDECLERWPAFRFRVCVDTAPLLEREHAGRAGLGAVGKHTLLIEPGVGSYLVLGAIVSTLRLAPGPVSVGARLQPGHGSAGALDPCGACTRCIDACPTRCISPWSVDASACLSYLTIEHRGVIPERFHGAMGDWLVGCDVCQEVCPHCQPTRRSKAAARHEALAATRDGFDVLEVLSWSEEERDAAAEGTALERVFLPMLRRNAIIVAGNTCPPERRDELTARLRAIAEDTSEDPVVRETARSVAARLAASG